MSITRTAADGPWSYSAEVVPEAVIAERRCRSAARAEPANTGRTGGIGVVRVRDGATLGFFEAIPDEHGTSARLGARVAAIVLSMFAEQRLRSDVSTGFLVRVLQIAPPWFAVPPSGYGGIEWIVASLADELVAAGHDVTLHASGGSVTQATLKSVYDVPPSLHIGNPWYEATHAVAAYADTSAFDIVHDHTGAIGPAIAAGRSGSTPVVNTLHGCWTSANELLYRAISRRVSLTAISHDQASRTPAGVELAGVVHNGIAMERYPFQPQKEDFLLFVGRASADKGPEIAIEVAKQLRLPLVMAMKVSEPLEVEYYESIILPVMHGADVDVRMHVGHDEKVELMGRARAVLVPIRWDEPFGLVMAEANACGTPVVVYRRGAAPEIISEGETGYLVDPGDVRAFIDASASTAEIDPHACRARIASEFSATRMVERYLALYERLLS